MLRILAVSIISIFLSSCTYYLGPNRWEHRFVDESYEIPDLVLSQKIVQSKEFKLAPNLLQNEAKKELVNYSSKFNDTILNVRVALANFLLEQDIEIVNQQIQSIEAWGTTGTSSQFNKKGDYDFSQFIFVHLVWYFKDRPDILFPETAAHIMKYLVIDNGSKAKTKAPNTLGLIRETENHILMKEASRYLKNQWLFEQTQEEQYNNTTNGMSNFLLKHLGGIKKTGFFEFNANPYISYTFEALNVLNNHARDEEIRVLCKKIMDAENWQYALGSYQLRKYGPFRRRMSRESVTSLFGDRHGVLIRVELAKANREELSEKSLPCCNDKSLIPATSDYILPSKIKTYIEEKPTAYYAKIGHGLKSSPEIYQGAPTYLLSAGGLRFGKRSQIVPRPSSLFLNDNAENINDCFHIKGKGNLNKWNNTGLYHNFMVGENEVNIPNTYQAIKNIGNWQIFQPYVNEEMYVCVWSQKDLGIILIEGPNYQEVLALNQTEKELQKIFYFKKNEFVKYKLSSKKKWVIKETIAGSTTRKFKKWKRFDVTFH